MNKLIAFLCFVSIILSPIHSFANENLKLVTELSKGQRAPFPGILLSKESAAKLFADIKFSEGECKLRLAEKLDIERIRYSSQIKALQIRLDTESERTKSLLSIKDERIKFLEKNYRPPAWYEQGELWLGIGVISGIAITIASAYAIGQAK